MMKKAREEKGVWIGISIIVLWGSMLFVLLNYVHVSFTNPLILVYLLLQTHLYTGLFITAHDAMHGAVSSHKSVNKTIGTIAAGLFAYNAYPKLFPKHHQHHRFVGTDQDPDYHHGSFIPWYIKFAREYVSIWQIVLMAITYEALLRIFQT